MFLSRITEILQFAFTTFHRYSRKMCVCVIFAMLNVSNAYAVGDLIKSQSVEDLTMGAYGVSALIGLFFVMLIWQMLSSKSRVNAVKKQLEEYNQIKANASVGILKVDLNGKILSVSDCATRLLGRMENKLLGQDFAACFAPDYQEQLGSLLTGNETSITAKSKASNMYLQLDASKLITLQSKQVYILTLTNINQTFKQKSFATQLLDQNNKTLEALNVGQLWFDLNNDSFVYDKKCASLTSLPIEYFDSKSKSETCLDQPIRWFNEQIHPNDLNNWTKALHNAASDGSSEVSIRLQIASDSETHSFIALYAFLVSIENTDTKKVHMCVLKNTQSEQYHQEADNQLQIRQTLLNASHNPIYSIDVKGNILWSNSPFNMLFRRMLPNNKSKNVFDSEFFPDEVRKLHQNSLGVAGRSYDIEFELSDPDHNSTSVYFYKLTLSFYSIKDRLSDQSSIGMIGILQDLSALKQSEQALIEQKLQLENMLNLAPVAIATIDKDDRIINANSVMSRRLGFSDQELKKQDFYHLFNEPEQAGKAAKQIHQTGHLRDFHASLKGKSKKLHPSELHVDVIDKGRQEYLCWISDRSDEQFQQDKFDSLLEHSSIPMATLGENGFIKLNQQACKFFCINEEFELYGVTPFSDRLNADEDSAKALKQIIDEVKASGKAESFAWEHQVGDLKLPCQATYVPLYKEQAFDSILCIWMDERELQKADEARQQAINLQQAAERQMQEKQKLLATSQDQLATKMRTLADTEQKLYSVQEDLNETQSEYTYLKQAHEDVTANLAALKEQYGQSRNRLEQAEKTNEELSSQLANSTVQMDGLNKQREEIAQALADSEAKYQQAQQDLLASEQNAANLREQQNQQTQKMRDLIDQIHNMKESVSTKDEQISQVNDQITNLQSKLNESSSATDKLRDQLEKQKQASEEAENARREIEHSYQIAQSELNNKERHLSHLQSEMDKLEEMSNQEKGDMQAQQSALKQELEDKLLQLQSTQDALQAAQDAAQKEKEEKATQQALLEKVQQELAEVESLAEQKQQALALKEQQQKAQQQALQQKLWSELKTKQLKLQETEQVLKEAKQQTESEKVEKEKHRQLFEQLTSELKEIEQRNAHQEAIIAQSDKQLNEDKEALKQEVEAKRQQLAQTKDALSDIQLQADKERLARIEQEQKLEQLTIELADVETRANKQKEMLAGSDEQWRKHHDEIEEQKKALQQQLEQAQQQNQNLQSRLANKLDALQEAESQVDKTLSGEQALQQDLDNAKQQAQELVDKIEQHEQKEQQLQQQLDAQRQDLENKETSISDLEEKQKALTDELASVQKDYANSKASLNEQQSSKTDLTNQMSSLENELAQSKEALEAKEAALVEAQQALAASQNKLEEQENALLSAHKQELQQATEAMSQTDNSIPEIEKLPMPSDANVWFDLLPYLQSHPEIESLPKALTALMQELQQSIVDTERALDENDTRALLYTAKKLVSISQSINSDALTYLMSSIQNDCTNGMVDNVSIRWPATKQGLEKTLRVIYSHLHA